MSSNRRSLLCSNVIRVSSLLQEARPYEEAISLRGAWTSGGSEVVI